jgi:uncharacterized membrane protein YhaH (DUF805 family)
MKQSWWKWLFTWQGRTGRTGYFLAGVALAAVKFLTDRSVAASFGETWQMWDYISASPVLTLLHHDRLHLRMYLALWAVAIPFFWIGIALTLRRLRDAGKRPEWIFLLFLPFTNFALFLWLAFAPGKSVESDTAGRPAGLIYKVGVPAVLLVAGVGLVFAVLDTQRFLDYGFGLFLGVPFVTGFIASWLVNLRAKCSSSETVLASIAPIAALGLALVLFKFDGLVCLIMALRSPSPVPLPEGWRPAKFCEDTMMRSRVLLLFASPRYRC